MRLQITHKTVYRFDQPMQGVVQSHRLTPSTCDSQSVLDWSVTVEGGTKGASFRDGAGDWIQTVTVRHRVSELVVDVAGTVDTKDLTGVLSGHKETVPPQVYLRRTWTTRADQPMRDLAHDAVAGITSPLEQAHALSHAVRAAIDYRPGETQAGTTAAEALALGFGVCQDHAHAMVGMGICLGIPARYVAGYLYAEGGGAMAEASHAWAELFVPELGWVGFDASNEVCPDERYIRLGSGYDAVDAAPIRGVATGAGIERLDVDVTVEQVQQ